MKMRIVKCIKGFTEPYTPVGGIKEGDTCILVNSAMEDDVFLLFAINRATGDYERLEMVSTRFVEEHFGPKPKHCVFTFQVSVTPKMWVDGEEVEAGKTIEVSEEVRFLDGITRPDDLEEQVEDIISVVMGDVVSLVSSTNPMKFVYPRKVAKK